MSSLRNAFKSQRTHRERHQPTARSKMGLLEKKKDYKLRADDYNRKQGLLRKLREKALDKNPDEFYFHMINSKTVDGKHFEKRKEQTMTDDELKLMQSRDLNYIVHKRTMEKNKIKRLGANLHFINNQGDESNKGKEDNTSSNVKTRKHTFFVDSKEEKKNFDLCKRLQTHPSLVTRVHNRPKLETLQRCPLPSLDVETQEAIQKQNQKAYKELEQRMNRERNLGLLQAKMEVRKAMQNKKQKPHKIVKEESKDNPAIIKWTFERKK